MARTADVVAAIKAMILSGELRPSERLPAETDLAAMLGVSRGPLREGVSALAAMGVLDTRQGDGTYVTSLEPGLLMAPLSFVVDIHSKDGARQFLAVRRVLECEAAGLAALHILPEIITRAEETLQDAERALAEDATDYERFFVADRGFHAVIAAASQNPVLAALIESISGRTARARLLRGIFEEGAQQRTIDEHRAVLAAVVAHDPDRARLRMAVHLVGVEDFLEVAPPQEL
jgi:GntR family transcriptional regulator, transcriptional repressor for pyruvate dehydrogenase complex